MKYRMWLGLVLTLMVASIRANDVQIPLRNIAAGTFYVEGEVAGMGAVEFLVDTGSGYTTINTVMLSHLERAGSAVFLKELRGVMADGSHRIVPVYRIPEIRLGACIIRDVEAAVFAAGTRPILGMRSLSRVSPFTFSTDPPSLQLSGCKPVAAEADLAINSTTAHSPARANTGDADVAAMTAVSASTRD